MSDGRNYKNIKDSRTEKDILKDINRYIKKINEKEKNADAKRIIKEIAYIINPLDFKNDAKFDNYMFDRILN
jgi:intergrase/recombinase